MNPSRRRAAALLALAAAAPAALALPRPAGRVVLTLTGRVAAPPVDFDMAMLEALPQHEFATGTPWHAGTHRFTGPRLADLLDAVGASGTTLHAIALNDYKVELPASDARRFPVIVARLFDGRPMAVRDKGPLFIVYPYDSDPALRAEAYYARSAWQLRTIEVR